MAFKLGSTSVIGTSNAIYTPPPAAANGLFSDGTKTFWSYPGTALSVVGSGYLNRTIMTHGFMAGGYKGSNPWRSVNKTWHANDITYYCGEQLDRPVAYTDGVWSDYNGYIFSILRITKRHLFIVNLKSDLSNRLAIMPLLGPIAWKP